jgi:hypothetical protein
MDLNELARQERRAYFRAWRRANRDKVQRSNQRYWENRAKQRQEQEVKPGGSTGANQEAHPDGR